MNDRLAGAEFVLEGLARDVARERLQQHGVGDALVFVAHVCVGPTDQGSEMSEVGHDRTNGTAILRVCSWK